MIEKAKSAGRSPLDYATPAPKRPVATAAITSLALGAAPLGLFAWVIFAPPSLRRGSLEVWQSLEVILGLVAGIYGFVTFDKFRNEPRNSRLAAAGCALGLMGLLTGIFIFAPIQSSRYSAPSVKCSSNLRQIGQAIVLYANDHAGRYPNTFSELFEEDLTSAVFVCPSSNDGPARGPTTQAVAANLTAGGHLSYVYLGQGKTTAVSPDAVIAYEPLTNHNTGMNVLYGDGHVDFIHLASARKLLAELNASHNPPRAEKLK